MKALFLMSLAVCLMGCSKETHLILFRLPEDFTGLFVVKDSPEGATISKSGSTYTLDVPASRTLLVANTSFVYKAHFLAAEYPRGKRLSPGGVNDASNSEVKLFELTSTMDKEVFYFVGTSSELPPIRGVSSIELQALLEKQRAPTK